MASQMTLGTAVRAEVRIEGRLVLSTERRSTTCSASVSRP